MQPQQYLYQQPMTPQKPQSSGDWVYAIRALLITILVVFGGGGVFAGWHALSSLSTVNSNTPITSNEAALPAVQAGWTATQTFSGNGPQQTALFTVPNDWKLVYACSGLAGGYDGSVLVQVQNADNSYLDGSAVDVNCPGNTNTTGQTEEHQDGSVYLHVIAAGNWTLQVQVPQ